MENAHPGRTCKGPDTCPSPAGRASRRDGRASEKVMEGAGLAAYIIGHVGDGNYHAMFMVDTADPAEMARQHEAEMEIV